MRSDTRYSYAPPGGKMMLGLVFFTICTLILGNAALSSAETLDWLVAAGSAVLAAGSLFGVCKDLYSKDEIILSATAVLVPKAVRGEPASVPYATIKGLHEYSISRQDMLRIVTNTGGVAIVKDHLGPEHAYLDFKADLEMRLAELR